MMWTDDQMNDDSRLDYHERELMEAEKGLHEVAMWAAPLGILIWTGLAMYFQKHIVDAYESISAADSILWL